MVKKTPAYKNRLRALELERRGGTTTKKKGNKQMDKYELILIFHDKKILHHYVIHMSGQVGCLFLLFHLYDSKLMVNCNKSHIYMAGKWRKISAKNLNWT